MGASPSWFIQYKEYHNHSYTVFLKKKSGINSWPAFDWWDYSWILQIHYIFIFKMSTRSIISYN